MTGPSASAGKEAADRLRDIESITDAGLAQLGMEDLLVELLDRAREVLTADTGAILLLEEPSGQLVATAARGLEDEVYQGVRIPMGRGFAGRIASTKQPVVIDDIEDAEILNPILRERGIRSLLGVPLLVGGRLLGVLHVGTVTPRRFGPADVELLQMVADRVALATHAHQAEGERRAAGILQRGLLPAGLPALEGIEVAVRYIAGEGDVGGDWFDLFVLPSGWACVTVGDVVGRGLHAAVVMGRIRSAVRAYALTDNHDPAAILDQVDRNLRHFEPREMATAVLALMEPSAERLHVSLAGHPAPVLATVDGPGTYLELPIDPPLGVAPVRPRRAATVDLPPGSVVTFYTDGLVERRGLSLDERLRRLCDTVTATPAEAVCRDVMGALVGPERPTDDIALLALRRLPPTSQPVN
jgi:putative methionine-R-sulfoxide reductase with GAF domain